MEIRIEAQIRAVGEEEEARARATATRRRRVETERAERFETACIERERTEAQSSWRGRKQPRRRRWNADPYWNGPNAYNQKGEMQ